MIKCKKRGRSESKWRSLRPLVLRRALRREFGSSSAVGQLTGAEPIQDALEIIDLHREMTALRPFRPISL